MKNLIRSSIALLWMLFPLTCGAQSIEQLPDRDSQPPKAGGESPQSPEGLDIESIRKGIVEQTNTFRSEHDLDAVSSNESLREAAMQFAEFMARTQKYGHTADGRRPSERATAAGYEYCIVLENIAYRYQSRNLSSVDLATRFVEGWKNSPEHRKNMLDSSVTETGVGVAISEDGETAFAVQMFGRPESAQLKISVTNRTESTQVLHAKSGESAREFEIPPRASLTLQRCRPTELHVGGKEKSEKPLRVTESADITIEQQEGEATLVRPSK